MFIFKDTPVSRENDALRIAVTVAPDFRQRAFLSDKGIVRWHRTIVIQADGFAEMTVQLLRLFTKVERIADRHHQRPVGKKDDPRAIVIALHPAGRGSEYLLAVADPRLAIAIVIFKSHQQKRVFAIILFSRIRNIQKTIFCKVGVQCHVEQTGLGTRSIVYLWMLITAGEIMDNHRCPVGGNVFELATTLGHQHVAIRKEGERPWMIETVGNGFDSIVYGSHINATNSFTGFRAV